MHGVSLLERWFERNVGFMHKARVRAVLTSVSGLLRGGVLTLSHVGRSLPGRSLTKHKIKRVDRLLGNGHLHGELDRVYGALVGGLLRGIERPVVLVDWSDAEPGRAWQMLTAVVSVGGRGLPIYQRVYPLSQYNSAHAHDDFLYRLRALLPAGCRPIVVTDAGFRGPWFRTVEALGWDWVGRVRNQVKVRGVGTSSWRDTTALYAEATSSLRALGPHELSCQHPYRAQLYLVKLASSSPRRRAKRRWDSAEQRCRRQYHDPWLLATSLPDGPEAGTWVQNLYAKRMQIEETFRDLKDERWSFGFAQARCHAALRREVMLLIAALAYLTLWLVGLAARLQGWARHFQANTIRTRDVLSTVFLGREVLRQPHLSLSPSTMRAAITALRAILRQQAYMP